MKITTRQLVKMAMYIALYIVLDFVSGRFLPTMPQGGSLGLSSIVLIIASFDLGLPKAILTSILALLISHMFDSPWFVNFFQYFLDYVVGYTAYAFARVFGKRKDFVLPILATNAIRFFGSAIAGVLYYDVPWVGSFIYQAWYIVPTIIVSLILVPLLYERITSVLEDIQEQELQFPGIKLLGWGLSGAMAVAIVYSVFDVVSKFGFEGLL